MVLAVTSLSSVRASATVGQRWIFVGERGGLEGVDPEGFAVEDVDDLGVEVRGPETRDVSRVVGGGDCGEVVERAAEAKVGPRVELADAFEGEYGGHGLAGSE